jgi:ketosteroid isomerase-like protein
MKSQGLFGFILMSSAFVGGLCGCSMTCNPDRLIGESQALDQRFIQAFNRGDVDEVMATYWNSPNLVFYPPGALELHGTKAVRDGYLDTFKNMPGARLQLLDTHYEAAGDRVIGWGTWRMTIPGSGATPAQELSGRYTEVMAEKDGKWVYVLDHPSVPLPGPTATMPAAK